MKKSEGYLAASAMLLVGIPLGWALYTWAAMLNWNWFAPTLGAPRVGFWQAFGLTMIAQCLQRSPPQEKVEDEDPVELVVKAFARMVVRFLVMAGIGWFAHKMMGG
jgi:hypothetical protein